MKVGVFVSHFSSYDAMCNDALEMYRVMRRMGVEAEFFVSYVADKRDDVPMRILGQSDDFLDTPENLLIFHHGVFEPIFDRVVDAECRKILRYHNITEPGFFEGYDEVAVEICGKGRDQMRGRLDAFEYCWSNSSYSAGELVSEFGGDPLRSLVLHPFHFVEDRFESKLSQECKEGFEVLSVGRISPHKNQLELVKGFLGFCDELSEEERGEVSLTMVGKKGPAAYFSEIEAICSKAPYGERIRCQVNGVTEDELARRYRNASVFAIPSAHEGFCVPVVEAMLFGLPIISSNSTALQSTVSCYGLRLENASCTTVSEALLRVYRNPTLRQKLARLSKNGFADYASERIRVSFAELLSAALGH